MLDQDLVELPEIEAPKDKTAVTMPAAAAVAPVAGFRQKYFGISYAQKPFAVLKYDSTVVSLLPFVPLTPWFKGTFTGSRLLAAQCVYWCTLLSWVSFSADVVAESFRTLESTLPPSIFGLITFILGLYVSLVLSRSSRPITCCSKRPVASATTELFLFFLFVCCVL